jgi:hypothetical protein
VFEFPPCSPDWNPIENLWPALQRLVEDHPPKVDDELQEAVQQEWVNLDKHLMCALARSMPARIRAVLGADGVFTKY